MNTDGETKLTAFLLFGLEDEAQSGGVRDWRKSGRVLLSDVGTEGFLPHGIFSRVLSKCQQWMQSMMAGYTEADLNAGHNEAVFSYGAGHKFKIVNCMKQCHIRVELLVSNPKQVLEKLQAQCEQVLREVMPGLSVLVAVPSDGAASSQGYAGYDGELLLLHGPNGLVQVEHKGKEMMVSGKTLVVRELRMRFAPFLPPKGMLDAYDVFESYRCFARTLPASHCRSIRAL